MKKAVVFFLLLAVACIMLSGCVQIDVRGEMSGAKVRATSRP